MIPSPGSPRARAQGCTCPIPDSNLLLINYNCPLHGGGGWKRKEGVRV